jgi:hypothetical protein
MIAAMRIEFMVPPDEARQRRMLQAMFGRQWRRVQVTGVIVVLLGAAAFAVFLGSGTASMIRPAVGLMLTGILLITLWYRIPGKTMRRNATVLNQIVSYEITEEEVGTSTSLGHSAVRWSAFTSAQESPEFWVLRVGQNPAVTIPRTYVPAADVAQLRGYMVQRGLLPV